MSEPLPQHEPERDPGEEETPVAALVGVGHDLLGSLFAIWQRALLGIASGYVRLKRGLEVLWRAWLGQWARVREYHASADAPWEPEGEPARRSAAAVGLRAFLAGMLLAGAATGTTGAWPAGVVVVMSEVLWAGARFIIIALLMPRGSVDRHRLSVAYGAGLVPYVFGTTPALRLVALAASAYLTRRGLLGAGVAKADARRAIAWSFGGQLAAYAGGLLLRAAVIIPALF